MLAPRSSPSSSASAPEVDCCPQDHLGTPQLITDENREVVWSADYEPFGKAHIRVEKVVNNLRFPGQYEDRESGYSYNLNRSYQSIIGEYLEPDPIISHRVIAASQRRMPAGLKGIGRAEFIKPLIYSGNILHSFSYASNNPLTISDRMGLLFECYVGETKPGQEKVEDWDPDCSGFPLTTWGEYFCESCCGYGKPCEPTGKLMCSNEGGRNKWVGVNYKITCGEEPCEKCKKEEHYVACSSSTPPYKP